MSGKGSKPRPIVISIDEYDNNWDAIFNKKAEQEKALEELMRISEEMGAYIDEPIDNPLIKK